MLRYRQNAILILASALLLLAIGFEAFSFLHTPADANDFPTEISKEETLSSSDHLATTSAIFDIRRFQSVSRSGVRESDDLGQVFTISVKKRFAFFKSARFSPIRIFFRYSKDYFVLTLERILC